MKRLLQKFNNIPVFFRLLIIIAVVFISLMILFSMNYYIIRNEKQSSTYQIVNQTNKQALSKIDDYLTDISNVTKIPLIYKVDNIAYMNYLNEFNGSRKLSADFINLNNKIFDEIFAYKNSIDSCFIFNLYGESDYKSNSPIYQAMNPITEQWFKDCVNGFGKSFVVDTYPLPNTANGTTIYVFGVARGIVNIRSGKIIGVLLSNTRASYLEEICKSIKITNGHRVIILHDNLTIYDTEHENIGLTNNTEITAVNWKNVHNLVPIAVNGEEMLASSVESDYSHWRIISLIPKDELLADLTKIQRSNIIFTTIIIIVTLALLFFISNQIVVPIKRLVKLMKLTENGDFHARININSNDEIGTLAKSYNSMTEKIDNLIHEVYQNKLSKSQLELQMLQAQINPHFIYNTLESISMMAILNDDGITSDMAANLGSILRYNISNYDQIVTISDEVDNLKKYIALQDVRFRSSFKIEINIDESLYNLFMPKMLLQPIVENAIYHGMSTIQSGGLIQISADKAYSKLEFRISDNGAGLSPEQVSNLNGYINDENNLFKSIGLRNVNKRIKLRYGNEYGLVISSTQGSGTVVTIRLRTEPNPELSVPEHN